MHVRVRSFAVLQKKLEYITVLYRRQFRSSTAITDLDKFEGDSNAVGKQERIIWFKVCTLQCIIKRRHDMFTVSK